MNERMRLPRVFGSPQTTVVVQGMPAPPEEGLARIQREHGRHTVVVAADPPLALAALAVLLHDHLPIGCRTVCLVLSRAGQGDYAQRLADHLRVEIVAPSGTVLLLSSGMLFVVGGEWITFRPDAAPDRRGARYPAPRWQSLLPDRPRLADDLALTEIPAGLWLHDSATPDPPIPPALLNVPVDVDRPTVLIGHALGGLSDDLLYEALEAMPRQLRKQLILVPYGRGSAVTHKLAERLAARTGGTIEVVAGVQETNVSGNPTRPFCERFLYRAAAPPRALICRPLFAQRPVTDGVQEVAPGWSLEIVRAGWWLRSAAGDRDADRARRTPVEPAHSLLVLSASVTDDPALTLRLVTEIAREMPAEITAQLRLVVIRPPADGPALQWRLLAEQFGELLAIVGDGDLVTLPSADHLVTGEQPLSAVQSAATIAPAVGRRALDEVVAEMPAATQNPAALSGVVSPGGRRLALDLDVDSLLVASAKPIDTAALRLILGAAFDRYAGPARALHGRLPRSADSHSSDVLSAECIALVALVAADRALYAEASALAAAVTCLGRLPVVRGPVLADWEPPPSQRWVLGKTYRAGEPLGAGVPSYRSPNEAPLIAVWSESGRWLPVAIGAHPASVTFPPYARFRVIGLDGDEPEVVLLREIRVPDAAVGSPSDEWIQEALRRLVESRRRAPEPVG